MGDFLVSLLGVSLIMGVVSIFMWGFKGKLRKLLKGSSRYLLWGLVILRLCIPVSLFGGNALVEIPVPEGISGKGEETLAAETVGNIIETQAPDLIVKGEVTMPDTPSVQVKPPVETAEEIGIPSVTSPGEIIENITPVVPSVTGENVWVSGGAAPSVTMNGGISGYVEPLETNMGVENITPAEPVIEETARGMDPVKSVFCLWLMGAVFFLLIEMIEYVRFLENLNINKCTSNFCIRITFKNISKALRFLKGYQSYACGTYKAYDNSSHL